MTRSPTGDTLDFRSGERTEVLLQPSDNTYRNTLIRITDLTVNEDVLRGLTFENCQIVGPAVLILLGKTLVQDCNWEATPESMIWVVEDDRDSVTGAIGLEDCEFYGCRFVRAGLAVKRMDLPKVLKGFGIA